MANITDIENLQKKLEVSLTQKMIDFEERLKSVSAPNVPTLAQLWDDFSNFKGIVTSLFSLMQGQLQDCITDLDKMNMCKRRKALLFHGIPEVHQENVNQLVLSLLNEKIGLSDIDCSFIKQSFRLGSSKNSPRPILVFFKDHETKAKIWKLKSKLKGSSISIGEFLTKIRQLVYNDACKHFGIKNVWTLDGAIHIKYGDSRMKITTQGELNSLISKSPVESVISPGKSVGKQACHTSKAFSQDEAHIEKARRQQPSCVVRDEESKKSRRLARK